ncbi:MAG: transcription elongation factor GreB [Myxococcales bacterium]|nr:transcription elongation factor GreB [Myxococcales bacterium]
MAEKNYITPGGYARLVEELTELATVERPRVVREVSDAAAEGDRSENAAYIYGKRRLREIDRRMGFLTRRLKHIQVVKPEEQRRDRVFFSAYVTVEDDEGEEHVYQIVGTDEVDAAAGRISWKSPVGRSLLGKELDDTVTVRWHAGQRELTVTAIAYEPPAAAATPATATVKPRAAKPLPGVDTDEEDEELEDPDGDAAADAKASADETARAKTKAKEIAKSAATLKRARAKAAERIKAKATRMATVKSKSKASSKAKAKKDS